MGIVKGSYVQCKKSSRKGVVSHSATVTAPGLVYVQWLSGGVWLGANHEAQHYLELAHLTDITELLSEHIDTSLITLNRRIMR